MNCDKTKNICTIPTYLTSNTYSKLKNLDAAYYRDIECFKITLTKKYVCFFKIFTTKPVY